MSYVVALRKFRPCVFQTALIEFIQFKIFALN